MTTVTINQRELDWSALNKGLCGPAALIVAIIANAYYDLSQGDLDAAGYFLSPYYRHHLTLLGLPDHWLPEGVSVKRERSDLEVVAVEEQILEI